jgi:hypothetical protein
MMSVMMGCGQCLFVGVATKRTATYHVTLYSSAKTSRCFDAKVQGIKVKENTIMSKDSCWRDTVFSKNSGEFYSAYTHTCGAPCSRSITAQSFQVVGSANQMRDFREVSK